MEMQQVEHQFLLRNQATSNQLHQFNVAKDMLIHAGQYLPDHEKIKWIGIMSKHATDITCPKHVDDPFYQMVSGTMQAALPSSSSSFSLNHKLASLESGAKTIMRVVDSERGEKIGMDISRENTRVRERERGAISRENSDNFSVRGGGIDGGQLRAGSNATTKFRNQSVPVTETAVSEGGLKKAHMFSSSHVNDASLMVRADLKAVGRGQASSRGILRDVSGTKGGDSERESNKLPRGLDKEGGHSRGENCTPKSKSDSVTTTTSSNLRLKTSRFSASNGEENRNGTNIASSEGLHGKRSGRKDCKQVFRDDNNHGERRGDDEGVRSEENRGDNSRKGPKGGGR
jgi:hypothetical protein